MLQQLVDISREEVMSQRLERGFRPERCGSPSEWPMAQLASICRQDGATVGIIERMLREEL